MIITAKVFVLPVFPHYRGPWYSWWGLFICKLLSFFLADWVFGHIVTITQCAARGLCAWGRDDVCIWALRKSNRWNGMVLF